MFNKDQLKRVFELLPDEFSEEQLLILLSEIDQINPRMNTVPWQSIQIGTQVWASQNLSVTHFQNEEPIPHIEDDETWEHYGLLGKPAWCYYNNDPATEAIYGRLYNWHAVADPRKIAPPGWTIPSDQDWEELIGFVKRDALLESTNSSPQVGLKLKGKNHWNEGGNGTDAFGFNAQPAGYRATIGPFRDQGGTANFWSSSDNSSQNAFYRTLYFYSANIFKYNNDKSNGISVRCLKEKNNVGS